MSEHYHKLLQKIYLTHDLEKANAVLGWDREVNMPKKGVQARVQQMTTLSQLRHQIYTSAEMGELIEAAAASLNGASYDSNEASLIRYLQYDYGRQRMLPPDFVRRSSEVSGAAQVAWEEAREGNDFVHFSPHLAEIVSLCQEMADYFGYEDEPYDALLDGYERGMKTADLRATFDALKESTVPLILAVAERADRVDDAPVRQHFPIAKQKEFAYYAAEAVGYDFTRGHLGTVTHPFATSFSRNDARITTRWNENFLNASLFGTLHESGHAMYEQGTHPDLARTPLARGTSMGIHESQSRLFENLVGRSLGFWRAHYPKLQATFPEQLGDVPVEKFYHAINKVSPSFIRVEADELTYNMHIILRFELEQALLSGDLAVADLPGAWNDKMQSLLGITPPTDREGCLQDIHWSNPIFGYFPTYALGNLYAAQLMAAAKAQNPAISEELAEGRTDSLRAWLIENIHQHGRKFPPTELVERATGQPLTSAPFVTYVTEKYSEIYGL